MQLNLPLERQLASILRENREDSYATQRKRFGDLAGAARALHAQFGLEKWANLKAKHVAHIVEHWKAEDTGHRGIESKLSHLRWLVQKIGKANLIPKSNAALGVEPGPRHTRAGMTVPDRDFEGMLAAVHDERIRVMMLLARHVGLRFKEAALFRPGRDSDGERIWVKRGTKGGQARYLWIHSSRQADIIDRARAAVAGDDAIIPRDCPTYEKWRQHVYRALRAAGVGRASGRTFHDLRRTYATERMHELVNEKGMPRDDAAALVARELGHHRLEIIDWYISAVL